MTDHGLRITRLRVDLLFSLDPGYWLDRDGRHRRFSFLHNGDDMRRVAEALRDDRQVYSVELARSLFEDTHRREHATLTTINFDDIAPLTVRLAEPIVERVGMFEVRLTDLLLSRDGPVAFPFIVRLTPDGTDRGLPVADLLRDFAIVRERSERIHTTAANRAHDIFSRTRVLGELSRDQLESSRRRTQRFEIFDFDYELDDGGKPSIQLIIEDPSAPPARELAGFIRMSRPDVWSTYNAAFLADFFRQNMGNRVDELWLFHGSRLIRHHPEEGRVPDVQLWFEDARLAMTILLQKATALEFLHWVMRYDLGEVRRLLAGSSSTDLGQAETLLGVVEELSNKIVDPMIIERHVSHEFFRKVLTQAATAVELPALSKLCRERLQDVRDAVEAIAAQVTATAALRSSRATERLTRQMYWLSVIVALLALAQLIMALRS